jgi:predicted SnoaL-like aldol condensation-catalyzing enzyme
MATPHLASAETPAKNKAIVQEMMDRVFNRHDFSQLDQVMAPDYVQHNPIVGKDRAGFRNYVQGSITAVPDWHFDLKLISAEGDMVWTYGAYGGTPQQQWGPIPPTGKPFILVAADLWRMKDGKIVEHWDVLDISGMMRQLGLLPAPGTRPAAPSVPGV